MLARICHHSKRQVVLLECGDQTRRVLEMNVVVGDPVHDQKLALQLVGIGNRRRLRIPLRVVRRTAHIPLRIYAVVKRPVRDRRNRNRRPEHVRSPRNAQTRHIPAVAPAPDTDPLRIHIRQTAEPLRARNLVVHLVMPEVQVGRLQEITPAHPRTAPLDHRENIALLRQHLLQTAPVAVAILHRLRTRSAIRIHQHRILFLGIEVVRFEQRGVQRHAVRCGKRRELPFAERVLVELRHRIRLDARDMLPARAIELRVRRSSAIRMRVEVVLAVRRKEGFVRSRRVGQPDNIAAAIEQHAEQLPLHRGGVRGGEVGETMRCIYPDQRVHIPFPLRQLAQHFARQVVQIEVVEAVAVGMPDELVRALDEGRIAPRIDPGFVLLRQNDSVRSRRRAHFQDFEFVLEARHPVQQQVTLRRPFQPRDINVRVVADVGEQRVRHGVRCGILFVSSSPTDYLRFTNFSSNL